MPTKSWAAETRKPELLWAGLESKDANTAQRTQPQPQPLLTVTRLTCPFYALLLTAVQDLGYSVQRPT